MYNLVTLLCTWNIVSQLYFNKIYIYVKKKKKNLPLKYNYLCGKQLLVEIWAEMDLLIHSTNIY